MYKVTLKNMGRIHESKGKTAMEALDGLKLRAIGGTSVLVITHNENKVERILPHVVARRAFTTVGMIREVALKNISLIFKDL